MTVCKIIHDTIQLQQKSVAAQKKDIVSANNLADTLRARKDAAGLAANMIGVHKNIIAFYAGPLVIVMLNPRIINKKDSYLAEEGCLSLSGLRKTVRYKNITVQYQNLQFEPKEEQFEGFTAEVIQHEIDHCNGILI